MESMDTLSRGVSMGWPYFVCPVLVRVSMESMDTLPRNIHGLAILCMSNVGQSIHGLSKAYPWIGYYVYPVVVSVWYNKGVTTYISAILSMSKVSQCKSIGTMHTLDKTH